MTSSGSSEAKVCYKNVILHSSICGPRGYAWLTKSAEATLEGLALKVNAKVNAQVLNDFPGLNVEKAIESESLIDQNFVLANVGSTTTQVYEVSSGRCLALLDGGLTKWGTREGSGMQEALKKYAQDYKDKNVYVAVVGAPGYTVEGTAKWHSIQSIDAPIAKCLENLGSENAQFKIAVLNRVSKMGYIQPNCDWGSALASLPDVVIKAAWPEGPAIHEGAIIVDLGGGYSRAYCSTGEKIRAWECDFRPNIKANDFLFDKKVYHPERLGKLEGIYLNALKAMAEAHPELANELGLLDVHIIGTGKARDAALL